MIQRQAMQSLLEGCTDVITPRFLLRVGGLPINLIDDLRFARTIQWHDTILSLEDLLAQQKSRLVDILHDAVGVYKEKKDVRQRLLNLKRDIFNIRVSCIEEARTLAQTLGENERPFLHEWLDLWERYQQQLALGPNILKGELLQKRSRLKEIVTINDFRKGILLSSPILNQAIDGYTASDNDQLDREARTVERSLLEYLFRAACKTSPFSTFTPVCIGAFARGGSSAGDIELELDGLEKQSFTRFNMTILSRLSAQILACLEIRKALLVQITNGWQLQNGYIKYIRRKPVIDMRDLDIPLPTDFIQEHLIQLPVGALLYRLLELMSDGREETLGAVLAHLCAQKPYQGAEAMVEEYLQHLLRLGFLIVPALQVDIHHDRPLDAYCQKLRAISTPQTNALAHHLSAIASLVDAYARASLAERAALLAEIKQLLQQCGTALKASQQSLFLPGMLLYEDTTLVPRRLVIHQDQESWTKILASIHEFQQLLPIFDERLPQKMMTRGYFQARYGAGQRCDDFFAFSDRFKQEFLRLLQQDDLQAFDEQGNFTGRPDYFNQPEMKLLNQARLEVAEYVQRAYQTLPAGSKELILREDFFQTLAPLVPREVQDFQSETFLSHFARVNREPLLVLNRVYPGLTIMFSRFAYCFAEDRSAAIVSTLRRTLEQLQPQETVFAELKGGYDATNLNLHPAVTPYELVCPGELSTRPQDEQIPLEDLFIQDDTDMGCLVLFSKRLKKRIIPLYLGFLSPAALPEIQQILLSFSYLTSFTLDLWHGTKLLDIPDADTPLTFYPRLRYKNLVVQRAAWKVHVSLLPRRESGETDAAFYLAVARWRKKLDLPVKVFFAPMNSSNELQAGPVLWKSKPFYVDFANYFSVLLLEATIKKTNTSFVITEMLPEPDQLWFKHDDQAYISEFVLEVFRTRRSHHEQELD